MLTTIFSLRSSHAINQLKIIHRSFAVVGRHSKNVAMRKNKLDAAKMKLFNRIAIKITMVGNLFSFE